MEMIEVWYFVLLDSIVSLLDSIESLLDSILSLLLCYLASALA